MAQLIKLEKHTSNKIEQLKLVLKIHCVLLDKKILSDTELTVMAYYMAYGVSDSTRQALITSGVRNSLQSISNVEVVLRKYGFLIKTINKSQEDRISDELLMKTDPLVMLAIKIDNRHGQ